MGSVRAFPAPAPAITRTQDIVQCLPYDVVSNMFSKLPLEDVFRCTSVNQTWFQFIINDATFWERVIGDHPGVNHLVAKSRIQYDQHYLRLYGPTSSDIVNALLEVTCHVSYFRKLELERLNLALHPELSRRVIRGSELTNLTLLYCTIDPTFPLSILKTATQLRRLTIIQPAWRRVDVSLTSFSPTPTSTISINSTSTTPFLKKLSESQLPYQFTYIKLSVGNAHAQHVLSAVAKALRRCPHLEYLYLDSEDGSSHGACIYEAAKASNRLRHCIVSPRCKMPRDLITHTAAAPDRPATPSNGLQTLVLTGGTLDGRSTDIKYVLTKFHKSIEFLYLHYDHYIIKPSVLRALATVGGAPMLRELRLSTELGTLSPIASILPRTAKNTMKSTLATLLLRTPNLEVFRLIHTFGKNATLVGEPDHLSIDDKVLLSIGQGCPRLRHLEISGQNDLPVGGLLEFSRQRGGLKLEYLGISYCDAFTRCTFTELVSNLPSLKVLEYKNRNPALWSRLNDAGAREILEARGGTVIAI